MNIIYPKNNFDLFQNYLPYKIIKYKDNKYYIMINIFTEEADIFGYSIYFYIDNKLAKSYNGNEIYNFLKNIDNDNVYEYLINGNDELIIGKDYFMSGEVITEDEHILSNNVSDFIDISSLKIKDIDNINYFIYKNTSIDDNIFTENELNNLNETFMKIIQEDSERYGNIIDPIDLVYKNVIGYYANGQYDDAIILMNSIFNTTLNTIVTSTDCGCNINSNCTSVSGSSNVINTGTDLISLDTATCIDKYKAAMYQWLIQMLSDVNFYCSWHFIVLDDDNNLTHPNDILIDKLIELLTEFLNTGYDLTYLKGCNKACGCGHTKSYSSNITNNSDCGDLLTTSLNNSDNCSNYAIIKNYINVLNWVKNNEIDKNKNKIYLYGKQFAEIFPLLKFE